MNTLIARLISFMTGGQSDFAMMLNHRWHGINLYAPLIFIGGLCFFASAICLALFILQWGKWHRTWLLLIAAFAFATAAYAASSTLGNLSAGSAISSTDLFYDVQTIGTGGVKVTGAQLQTFLPGTVTSIATSCGAAGGTITGTGTIQSVLTPITITSGNYTSSYCGELINYNSASNQSPTLPQASVVGAGFAFITCSIQHAQTITPNSTVPDTIGGASTYALGTGTEAAPTCVQLTSDGVSNWNPVPYGGGSGPTLAGANAWTGANSWSVNAQNFSATGSATTPTIEFGECGAECGFFAPASGEWGLTVGGSDVVDWNITNSGNYLNVNGGIQTTGQSYLGGFVQLATLQSGSGTTLNIEGGGNKSVSFSGSTGAGTLYNQPTTGTITYAVCAASGANGTGGGAIILDTSVTICGLSGMQFKTGIAAFDQIGNIRLASLDPETDHNNMAPHSAAVDPFEILRLAPAQYQGDGKTIAYTKTTFGIMAQDACDVDERLCARFPDGTPRTPVPSALMALQVGFDQKLWAVIQHQQEEINDLKAQLTLPTIQHAMAQ